MCACMCVHVCVVVCVHVSARVISLRAFSCLSVVFCVRLRPQAAISVFLLSLMCVSVCVLMDMHALLMNL